MLSALANAHDPVYLQTHPLAKFVQERRSLTPTSAGRALRQALLDAIASLRPPGDRPGDDRATRRYRVLHLRYADGLEPEEVQSRLGIGKSLYYTEHKLAVDAVIAALGERWLKTGDAERAESSPNTRATPEELGDVRLPLPAALTSFVGRETEVGSIVRLLGLADDGVSNGASGVRLLTLVGPAGAGKTRLALEVGRTVAARTSACFVDLAHVRDPDLVPATIARVVGASDGTQESLTRALDRHAAASGLLLLLDNLEQVLGAARHITALLRDVPRLRVLVTSRSALGAYGEWEFPVTPLPLPADGEESHALAENPAVRLFVERARAVRPDFRLDGAGHASVAEIARRLDGLPLAIELAAARVRHLTPAELVTRLEQRLALLARGPRDLPDRQRTLEGAIAWSYQLLEPQDHPVFRRLGIFVGGASAAAAAAVCEDETGDRASDAWIQDRLESLAAQSLARFDAVAGDRCTLLETIREYALAQLTASGEAADVRERHATYFLRMTEEAEPHLLGRQQGEWLRRLDDDYANLRAAVQWFIETRQAERGLRLASALRTYWVLHGHWSEGREWLTQLLVLTEGEGSEARVKALDRAGTLAGYQGDSALARRFYEEGLALARRLGDRAGEARCLVGLGNTLVAEGDFSRARAHHEEALEIFRASGDERGAAAALAQIGITHYLGGAYDEAEGVLVESLAMRRALGDLASVAHSLNLLGAVLRCAGKHDRARGYLEECLSACSQLGHRLGSAVVHLNLALVALAERGDGAEAAAAGHMTRSLALYRDLGDTRGLALGLEVAGLVLSGREPTGAAETLGAAAPAVERSGARRPPADALLVQRTTDELRRQLGESTFDRLAEQGRSITTYAACDLTQERLARLCRLATASSG